MDQSIKNYLSIALVVLSVVGAFGIVYYTTTYARSLTYSSPAFSVSGEGKVVAIPDIAQFTFSVINEGGTNLGQTQERNNETTNAVIEFLKANGIESKDIKTVGYNVSPRYSSSLCGPIPLYYDIGVEGGGAGVSSPVICPPSQIVGYTVSQTVQVKIRNLENVGNILSGVVENGANEASSLTFTVDDRASYENEARAMAIEQAREKAKEIADAGGFRVGKLLSVDEYFGGPIPYYAEGLGGDFARDSIIPSVEPGSQEITISVSLRYEIK